MLHSKFHENWSTNKKATSIDPHLGVLKNWGLSWNYSHSDESSDMCFICLQLTVWKELTCSCIESFAYKYVRKSKIIRTEISEYLELRIKNKVHIILLQMKNEKWKLTTDKKPENTKISYSNSRASCCLRLNKRTRQIQISTNLRFIVYFVRKNV